MYNSLLEPPCFSVLLFPWSHCLLTSALSEVMKVMIWIADTGVLQMHVKDHCGPRLPGLTTVGGITSNVNIMS